MKKKDQVRNVVKPVPDQNQFCGDVSLRSFSFPIRLKQNKTQGHGFVGNIGGRRQLD